jgi:hypothetical protein
MEKVYGVARSFPLSIQLGDHRLTVYKEVKRVDVKKAHFVIGVIHILLLIINLHVAPILGSPFHILNSILPRVLCPVFFLIRHMKVIPDQVARQELDVWASFADHNPGGSSSGMQTSLGLKTGEVITFKGYMQAVFGAGAHMPGS